MTKANDPKVPERKGSVAQLVQYISQWKEGEFPRACRVGQQIVPSPARYSAAINENNRNLKQANLI